MKSYANESHCPTVEACWAENRSVYTKSEMTTNQAIGDSLPKRLHVVGRGHGMLVMLLLQG